MLDGPVYGEAWITLEAPGRITGNTGCNSFQGVVSIGKRTLNVGALASTKKLCPDELISTQEARMLSILSGDLNYARDGAKLSIAQPSDGASLTFEK